MTAENYNYHVIWSPEDGDHIGLCAEFPMLAWLDKTPDTALQGVRGAVEKAVATMRENGQEIPTPIVIEEFRASLPSEEIPQIY
jgi:predicted RNase H-like HicB family nuclease